MRVFCARTFVCNSIDSGKKSGYIQYRVGKFSSDTLNHSLRICPFGSSFFLCPKMELKQCCPPEAQAIAWKAGEIAGPFACPHSKCKRREALGFRLLKPDVSQLRNIPEPKISTEFHAVWAGFFPQQDPTIFSGKASPPSMAGHRWGFEGQGFVSPPCYPSCSGFHHSRGIRIDWEIWSGPKVWQITRHFHKMQEFGNCQFTLVCFQLVPFSADWLKWLLRPIKHLRIEEGGVSSLFYFLLAWVALLPPEQGANEDLIIIFFF